MFKPLLFYTIGEYADVDQYCRRKGFKPHRKVMKTLDGQPFPVVTQYTKGGYVYDVLGYDGCYSGYMATLMRLPQLSYNDLLSVALTSCSSDERAGAIGMILKDHPKEFESYLAAISAKPILDKREIRQIIRLAKFISDFVQANTSYVDDLKRVMSLCREIAAYKG